MPRNAMIVAWPAWQILSTLINSIRTLSNRQIGNPPPIIRSLTDRERDQAGSFGFRNRDVYVRQVLLAFIPVAWLAA